MFTPHASSSSTRKSIQDMDLDDLPLFEVVISTSESTWSSQPSKRKKVNIAHKNPTYPTISYTNFVYDTLKVALARDGGSCLV